MPSGEDTRDRLADDIYLDRRITTPIYCGECGYNLITLPRCYSCPECGNEYTARGPEMKGVFVMRDAEPPMGSILSVLVFGAITAVMVSHAINPMNKDRLMIAGMFGCILALETATLVVRLRPFLKYRHIIKRINSEEDWL